MDIFHWIVIQIYTVYSRFIIINLWNAHTMYSFLADNREKYSAQILNLCIKRKYTHSCTCTNMIFMKICTSESSAHNNKLYLLSSGNDFFIIYVLMRYYRKTTDSKRLSRTKSGNRAMYKTFRTTSCTHWRRYSLEIGPKIPNELLPSSKHSQHCFRRTEHTVQTERTNRWILKHRNYGYSFKYFCAAFVCWRFALHAVATSLRKLM